MNTPYNTYSAYLKSIFNKRAIKISINSGLTCPNKVNGSGCIFCDEQSFLGEKNYSDINEQINKTIKTIDKTNYAVIAYFQSGTNTYGDITILKNMFDSVAKRDDIDAIIIGTRPDCIDDEVVRMLSDIAKTKYTSVELGLQSSNNKTLETINRGHNFESFIRASNLLSGYNIVQGCHVILGLPGESEADFIATANHINSLNIKILKIHNLHITRGTKLHEMYAKGAIKTYSLEEYATIVSTFLGHIKKEIVISRIFADSDKNTLIAPQWGGSKIEAIDYIRDYMNKKSITQGCFL